MDQSGQPGGGLSCLWGRLPECRLKHSTAFPRAVSHCPDVFEHFGPHRVHICSLIDPIDTTTLRGIFSLQVLGATARVKLAVIVERTWADVLAARSRGRVGGNPGRALAIRT